jgi:hypothetical protein
VSDGQHPATVVAPRSIHHLQLGEVDPLQAGLLLQGAGGGIGENFALVQKGPWQCGFPGSVVDDDHLQVVVKNREYRDVDSHRRPRVVREFPAR